MGRDYRWSELYMAGWDLDEEAQRELEQALEASPDDLDLRVKLMGSRRQRGLPRGEDLLWLAQHHPAIELAGFDRLPRELIPAVYDAIVVALEAYVAQAPHNTARLRRLADFVRLDDPQRSISLLRQCCEIEPGEAEWATLLGNALHQRRAYFPEGEEQKSSAAEALAQYERALALEPLDLDGHLHLLDVACAAMAAGQTARAVEAAERVLREASAFENTWQFGNSIHHGNIVLGLVAMAVGDHTEASRRLLAAGKTRGSPQLDSFGPDAELANRLLGVGAREAVLEYLRECQRFWEDKGQLARAIEQVERGDTPCLWQDVRGFAEELAPEETAESDPMAK